MQSGQVSVWVPIVVGVIGLLGVVAGQLVNAWRERKREELRWRRERHTESIKLNHEHAAQWRETKIKIYRELLESLRKAESVLYTMLHPNDEGLILPQGAVYQYEEPELLPDVYRDAINAAMAIVEDAKLVCSEEFFDVLGTDQLPILLFTIEMATGPVDQSSKMDLLSRGLHKLQEFRAIFLEAARKELGVGVLQISDPQ
ncbi:MAG TPA: hypothetical protein VG674_00085 [Amycolatopsis sp.]|nr:hypothetical protein [Amycolatopsis sp.]